MAEYIELFEDKSGWSQGLKDFVAVVRLVVEVNIKSAESKALSEWVSNATGVISEKRGVTPEVVVNNIRSFGYRTIDDFVVAFGDFLEDKEEAKLGFRSALINYTAGSRCVGGNAYSDAMDELLTVKSMYKKAFMQ